MQVLEPQELNLIFDYMTKHHPVDNMEEVLSKQAAERKAPTTQVVRQQPAKKAAKGEGKKAEAKKAEPQKKAAPQPAKEEAKQGQIKILAVTGCPTGIAHTFMAAENLEKKGKEMGIPVKVETQGADGAKNVLTPEQQNMFSLFMEGGKL